MLATERLDGSSDATVVLLHGGGQTRGAWGGTARRLQERGWTTVAADLRGHGESAWAEDGDYSLEAMGGDVVELAESLGGPVVLVGASMGGLSSMVALDLAPRLPAVGLVLVDIAHRFQHSGARRITEFMGSRPDGFADLDEAVAAVAAYQPHREKPSDPAGLLRNLREHNGRLRWHWDPRMLDNAERLYDAEERRALEERLTSIVRGLEIPARLVRGSESDVVTAEIAADFERLNARADVVSVEGARHMVAGDRNDAFSSAVVDFLETRCRVSAS